MHSHVPCRLGCFLLWLRLCFFPVCGFFSFLLLSNRPWPSMIQVGFSSVLVSLHLLSPRWGTADTETKDPHPIYLDLYNSFLTSHHSRIYLPTAPKNRWWGCCCSSFLTKSEYNKPYACRLPSDSSIYTAEPRAILVALRHVYHSEGKSFLILSHSASALHNLTCDRPALAKIHDLYLQLIRGDEFIPLLDISIPLLDISIFELWQQEWDESPPNNVLKLWAMVTMGTASIKFFIILLLLLIIIPGSSKAKWKPSSIQHCS